MTRTLLTLAVLALFVLCLLAMWLGWQRRARRQRAVLPAFPDVPSRLLEESVLLETTGVYVGTVNAGDWQDRITVGDIGHRAAGALRWYASGLVIERTGAATLWIPASSLVDARTDRALAGKVMGTEGLLVVRWRLGEYELDTGFRGDDKAVYPQWIEMLRAAVPVENAHGQGK
ncbi:MAG: transporter [Pseudonocardiaceae bacterium]|nr:transporter [Pseudonocardiaceae bacterium]